MLFDFVITFIIKFSIVCYLPTTTGLANRILLGYDASTSTQILNSSFSPRSPRENVNHGGQESQRTHVRQNILLNVQNEDVANTWTEVLRARTSRLDRQKVSYQSEKKYFTPSPFGPVKRLSLSSTTEQKRSSFNKARSTRFAKEEKSQKELAALKVQSNALQAQVVTLTSTLDNLMVMLKGMTRCYPASSPVS